MVFNNFGFRGCDASNSVGFKTTVFAETLKSLQHSTRLSSDGPSYTLRLLSVNVTSAFAIEKIYMCYPSENKILY
jgi:hypothetical protein